MAQCFLVLFGKREKISFTRLRFPLLEGIIRLATSVKIFLMRRSGVFPNCHKTSIYRPFSNAICFHPRQREEPFFDSRCQMLPFLDEF
jgi:hypothetical protein